MLILRDLRWAHAEFNRDGSHRPGRRLRFLIRSLLAPRCSQAWFSQLREFGLLAWTSTPWEWLQQPHRPFFDHRLPAPEVVRVLMHDLRTSIAWLGARRVALLAGGQTWTLARLQGRAGTYTLGLRKEAQFSKEGTLSLCLLDDDGTSIQRVVFSFAPAAAGGNQLLVGCMQAVAGNTADVLREATRDLHTLQPRLLLRALKLLAGHLGCTGIQAVSSRHHVYHSPRYRRRGKLLPDYDELWRLAGGTLRPDGNYALPLAIADKRLEDVPSNKRATYRRRLELTESLQAQVRLAFA